MSGSSSRHSRREVQCRARGNDDDDDKTFCRASMIWCRAKWVSSLAKAPGGLESDVVSRRVAAGRLDSPALQSTYCTVLDTSSCELLTGVRPIPRPAAVHDRCCFSCFPTAQQSQSTSEPNGRKHEGAGSPNDARIEYSGTCKPGPTRPRLATSGIKPSAPDPLVLRPPRALSAAQTLPPATADQGRN